MSFPSARHEVTASVSILLTALALTAAAEARGRHAPRPSREPPLALYQGGCRFPPAVEATFQQLARKIAGQPPSKVWVRKAFSFGPLHGVGVAMESHSGFSGRELYFREDQAALQRALTWSGLHVDRHGNITEAARFVDRRGRPVVGVSIHGIEARKVRPHFTAARSWLGCGAFSGGVVRRSSSASPR